MRRRKVTQHRGLAHQGKIGWVLLASTLLLMDGLAAAQTIGVSSTLADTVHTTANLTTLDWLLQSSGLRSYLQNTTGGNFTLFAPNDAAWAGNIAKASITCTFDYYVTSECDSLADLGTATNLQQILLDHVVLGSFDSLGLMGMTRLQFASGSVQPVIASPDGTVIIGTARVMYGNIPATNGVLHIMDDVLMDDISINSTAVAVVANVGDFGPFNRTKRDEMFTYEITFLPATLPSLRDSYRRVRMTVGYPDGSSDSPMALSFMPGAILQAGDLGAEPAGASLNGSWQPPSVGHVSRPASDEDLAFMTIQQLGALLRSKAVTSVELVRIYMERLKKFDPYLQYVVTYTEDLAYAQAAAADSLFAQGTDLGPLQGIPYGLKDLIAVEGYRTTWGMPSRVDQVLEDSAHVYRRLRRAGAVLLAKLATGEMAFDDVWWGGKVKNPWNIEEGSSGSSAGPAAAVVAGALPFAVGTETEGSLMAPAERTGATAIRPTFGCVGRSGVMSLVDSLDKMGPFCRAASDCALILDTLRGRDPDDVASQDLPLGDPFAVNLSQLTLGVLPSVQGRSAEFTAVLAGLGVGVKPFVLNYTTPAADIILAIMAVEAAANFDFWQRSGTDDTNRRQDFWPPLLRLARMIPAVEYIQAQRARTKLVQEVAGLMAAVGIDAFIGNTSEELAMANLASLPTVALPLGFQLLPNAPNSTRRHPNSIGIFGAPLSEATVLALAMAFQNATRHHLQRPPVNDVEPAVLAVCTEYSRCGLPESVLAALHAPSNSSAPSPGSAPSKAASSG